MQVEKRRWGYWTGDGFVVVVQIGSVTGFGGGQSRPRMELGFLALLLGKRAPVTWGGQNSQDLGTTRDWIGPM